MATNTQPQGGFLEKAKQAKTTPISHAPQEQQGVFSVDYTLPQEWSQSVNQQTQILNYSRAGGNINQVEYDDRGIPVDWDYKKSRTGPNGNPLPNGAVGWLPNGQADFGPGIAGWWKKITTNFYADRPEDDQRPDLDERLEGVRAGIQNTFQQELERTNGNLDFVGGLKVTGSALLSGFGAMMGLIGDVWHKGEGDNLTALSAIPRFIGAATEGLTNVLIAGGEAVEHYVVGPSILASSELIVQQKVVSEETVDKWKDWIGPLGMFPVWASVGSGLLSGKITREELRAAEADERNRLASRIAYSAWKDPALKEEFARRVRAGEDPRLLAMELEDPVQEMLGELLFDPLNVLGWGAGKVFSKVRATRAAKAFVASEDITDAYKGLQVATKAGNVEEIAAASNRLFSVLDEAKQSRLGAQFQAATRRGLFWETAKSKQLTQVENFTDFYNHILTRAGLNTDDTMRVLRGMTMVLDPDNAKKLEGIAGLNDALAGYNIAPEVLFSGKGMDSAILFRDIVTNTSGDFDFGRLTKIIENSGGDAEKLAELLGKDLEDIIEARFPSLQNQIKQYDEYQELVKSGASEDALSGFLAKNPAAATEPSNVLRKLLPVHETLQKFVYRPAAGIQGTIFMGMNPAYRMRNRFGNFAVLFHDSGPVAAVKSLLPEIFSPKRTFKQLDGWMGGQRVAAEARGIGPIGSFDGNAWIKGKLNYFGEAAARDEKIAGQLAMLKPVRQTIMRSLNERQVLEGMSNILRNEDDTKLFLSLVKREVRRGGGVREAYLAFRDKRGIDVGRTMTFLDDRQLYKLQELGLEDVVREIVENPELGREEVAAQLQEVMDGYVRAGLDTAQESVMREMDEFTDDFIKVEDSLGEARSIELKDPFERRLHAAQSWGDSAKEEFISAKDKIATEYRLKLQQEAIAAGRNPDEAIRYADRMITELENGVNSHVDDVMKKTRSAHTRMRDHTWKLNDEANKMTAEARIKAWKEEKLGAAITTGDLTPRQFKDALWKKYFSEVEKSWDKAWRAQVKSYQTATDGMHSLLVGSPTEAVTPLRSATTRRGLIYDLMKRAELGPDNSMAVNITQSEMEQLVSFNYEKLLKEGATKEVAGSEVVRGAQTLQNNLKGWRDRIRAGTLTAEEILPYLEPEMKRALTSIAGPGQEGELLKFLLNDPQLIPTQEGITRFINSLTDAVEVNPTLHVGLIEREGGLGLASIDPITDKSGKIFRFKMTLTDELLNQAPAKIQETLAHELSHVAETLPGGQQVLSEAFGGDFESFARAILEESGVPQELKATTEQLDAIRGLLKNNPEIAQPIKRVLGTEVVDDASSLKHRIPVVGPADDGTPSPNRFMFQSTPAAQSVMGDVIKGVNDNWGRLETRLLSADQEAKFASWLPQAEERLGTSRFVAGQVGTAARDFALHNYGKRYGIDLLASYIFPYQFWYSRSYAKWMRRVVEQPGIASAYLRYRKTLESLHAGLPDWYKYQLNTNELLGLDAEHPLWFNLEALVNPLNGITGVDFSDPKRRKDQWGAWMEDINKFGPSVWAPYQLALALKYHFQGDDDAAARWGGRLLPFSQSIRNITALMDPKGLGVEIDPYVHLFGGGIEVYERGRVGRQLGGMLGEGKFSEADIIDATYNQKGEIWDLARARSINDRAPNILMATAPLLFGAGLKPRSENDIQIDRMYQQIYGLIDNRDALSESEYRQSWDQLRQQYPFMDTVIMSKKSGADRDEALAWNTLGRIPPGMTGAIAERAGINKEDIDNFYEAKGDLSNMTEAERLRFVGTVLEIAGLLEVPDNATRAEWNAARNLYSQMRDAGEQQFGANIWDMVDFYFATRDPEDPEAGRAFLKANPIVSEALDWQQVMVQNTPLLASYYTSDDRIRQYYKQQMYQTAEHLFGDDLWEHFDVYSRLKELGEDKAARAYWKDNPQLSAYMQFKEDEIPLVEDKVSQFGRMIPEALPPQYRGEQEVAGGQPMPYNPDTRESAIMNQVMTYSQSYTDFSGRRTDIREVIRKEADQTWPNTRAGSNQYYNLLSSNPDAASQLLGKNAELEARVRWEYEQLLRLELAQAGEFTAAAAGNEENTSFQEILNSGPLRRLLSDPEGIPAHLAAAYGLNQ